MLFSSPSLSFFLTRPVYLLNLPTTNAPIAFLNKWVTMRHVVAQITATPTEMQLLGRKSGCTLRIPFKHRASSNTAFTLQRQCISGCGGEGAASPPSWCFFSCLIKVFQHSSEFSVMKGLQPACSIRRCTTG